MLAITIATFIIPMIFGPFMIFAGEIDSVLGFLVFPAIFCSLLPAVLTYYTYKKRTNLIKTQSAELSRLRRRNESIQHSLNQKQRAYDDLKRKRTAIEQKIAHFEREMKRVKAL